MDIFGYNTYKIKKQLSQLKNTESDLKTIDSLIIKSVNIKDKELINSLDAKKKEIENKLHENKVEISIETLDFSPNLNPAFVYSEAHTLVNAAIKTGNNVLIEKALTKIKSIDKAYQTIEKGVMEDPFLIMADYLGFKSKLSVLDWRTLRNVSYSAAVRPVHQKIINYVSKFAKPQKDKFSIGFFWERRDGKPLSKKELDEVVPELTKFVMQTGIDKDNVRGSFEQFMKGWIWQSLTYDHAPVEVVWNSKKEICFFRNLDAETIRLADTYFGNKDLGRTEIDGKLPAYIQMLQEVPVAEFYDWELWLTKRNASPSLSSNGYGRSELEDLVIIITAIMNSINYNSNSFIEGIPASSLLWMKGGSAQLKQLEQQLRSFKQNINSATVIGVATEEKPEVIKVRDNNKDMEYSQFMSFLFSLVCSAYGLIPESVGLRGSASANISYESGVDERVRTNLNQAIEPNLTCFEAGFNNSVTCHLRDGVYQMRFGGYEGETKEQLQDRLVKVASITPFNSILEQLGEPKDKNLPEGWVLNAAYIQSMQVIEQMKQGAAPQGDQNGEQKPQPQSQQPENDIKKGLEIDYLIEKLY